MSAHRIPFTLVLTALVAAVTWSACGGGGGPTCQASAETCNGLDDDCDGQTDEGFDLGTACTVGVGACQASGVMVCAPGGASTLCSARAGGPTPEVCNQVDDDCDGQVDQGLAGCCQPTATRACGVAEGVCQAGLETCSDAGAWGECLLAGAPVILPGAQPETCDGVDDDCDGQTDEADAGGCTTFFEDQDLDGEGAGPGACLCAATPPFTATSALDCDDAEAGVHPGAPELCNGKDDDCDGLTDGGAVPPPSTCQVVNGFGSCPGAWSCGGADGWTCTGAPAAAETCNGADDDCDGQTDEDFAGLGSACTVGTGACAAAGTRVCRADGTGTDCSATAGAPQPEACNGVDDDCDGATDEDVPGAGVPCDGSDADQCLEGVVACVSGSLTCTDATGDSVELCNGVDDDCDGATDENFPDLGSSCSVGTGACAAAGTRICKADLTGTQCSAVPGAPQPEACNGLDDDCDGATDEALAAPACPLQAGVCAGSQAVCGGAQGWLACGPASYGPSYQPVETTCDALDNDCDGATDTDAFPSLGLACSAGIGACVRTGVQVCAAGGAATACSAVPGLPQPELCNGVDDDCDGATDENFFDLGSSCSVGTGACAAAGTRICKADLTGTQCSAVPGLPQPELCNGVDDDCDGATDDNLPAVGPLCENQMGVCGGAHKAPALCVSGAWVACTSAYLAATVPSYQPTETLCDGLDNDCDGATDESLPAPSCALQAGVCAGSRMTCGGVQGWLACGPASYGPSYQPVEATCDGLDNDCDGMTDEDLPGPPCENQNGVCAGARKDSTMCVSGTWTACTPAYFAATIPDYEPAETRCDGRDNDCDGTIDEGCPP